MNRETQEGYTIIIDFDPNEFILYNFDKCPHKCLYSHYKN
jgi:hypothetical protein